MKFLVQRAGSPVRMSEEQFYLVMLTVMAALAAAIATDFTLDMHRNFLTIACDTAEFQNAMVNTLHGHFFRDTVTDGPNLLGMHSFFVFLLIEPLYVLFPSPDTLFILQIWSVYATVIPLYLVAHEILKQPLAAFLIAASALINPLLVHMAMAPFHPETWIAAAVFWSYYFYRRHQPVGFWVALGIALTSGEEACFILLALGTVLFVIEDGIAWRKRYGIIMFAVSLSWLLLSVWVISPLMRVPEQQNLFSYHYKQWNIASAQGLVLALAENPVKAVTTLFDPIRWAYIAGLAGPPFLLMFFSRQSLILAAPLPIYFLMYDQEFFLYFHAYYYQFAFFAGYMGLIFFLLRWSLSTRLGTAVLAFTFFLSVPAFCVALNLYMTLAAGRDEVFSSELHQAFNKIPVEAAVYGPHRYSAYLSARENMVMGDLSDRNLNFKTMIDKKFVTTNVHADQIDYIVCDYLTDQCGWRQGNLDSEVIKRRSDNINSLVQSGQWRMFWNQDDVAILQRAGK